MKKCPTCRGPVEDSGQWAVGVEAVYGFEAGERDTQIKVERMQRYVDHLRTRLAGAQERCRQMALEKKALVEQFEAWVDSMTEDYNILALENARLKQALQESEQRYHEELVPLYQGLGEDYTQAVTEVGRLRKALAGMVEAIEVAVESNPCTCEEDGMCGVCIGRQRLPVARATPADERGE